MKFSTEGIEGFNYNNLMDSIYANIIDDYLGDSRAYGEGICHEFYSLKSLIKLTGERITEKEIQAKELLKTNSNDEEAYENTIEVVSPIRKFRPFTYRALFLLAYSMYESNLLELCFIISNNKESTYKNVPDYEWKNNTCELFIKAHMGEDILDKYFNERKSYQGIRNSLMHRGGIKIPKDIRKSSLTLHGIEICPVNGKESFKINSSDFILSFIDKAESTLRELANFSCSLPNKPEDESDNK